ncbi:hypothetical protein T07_7028 [Trichinella nelsoni]|uniref:Uncharacterized protein n=1 Tax=Trichinella nelsoni TaxID=6336 RepID=A0A0V0RM37_9BILA|nr:hypothetical protein T07_7028 [Trichinella nelsoni]
MKKTGVLHENSNAHFRIVIHQKYHSTRHFKCSCKINENQEQFLNYPPVETEKVIASLSIGNSWNKKTGTLHENSFLIFIFLRISHGIRDHNLF